MVTQITLKLAQKIEPTLGDDEVAIIVRGKCIARGKDMGLVLANALSVDSRRSEFFWVMPPLPENWM